jgi:RNA polymerase sigma factor (sigma-70 family)
VPRNDIVATLPPGDPAEQSDELPGFRADADFCNPGGATSCLVFEAMTPSDAELVALTLVGDTRAFGTLVSRYQGSVHGLAYAIVADWSEAEDLVQSAFLRAYLQLAQLREPEKFAPWLRRVVTSVCLNWLETHRPARRRAVVDVDDLDLDSPEPPIDEELARQELARLVSSAVEKLPARYRVPLAMFYLDGQTYEGVAAMLGKSVGTIKSLVHRAREQLRGPLMALGDEVLVGRLPKEFAMRIADIIEASKRGDVAAVAKLLAGNTALANAKGEHDKTPLHWAAETNQREIVELLVAAGADIELQTSWGATALEWAATLGSKDVGRALLERGARGLNLWTAAGLGLLEVVASYFEAGPPGPEAGRGPRKGDEAANIPPDSAVMTGDVVSDAFYIACRNGELEIAKLLLRHGAEINAKGYFGATGLHWAAHNGHGEVVRWLLDRGADPNGRDSKFHSTPAGWAMENGHRELAVLVVASGARVDVREAANFGLIDRVRELIDEDPARVDERGEWGTPLHEAVFFGHRDIVELLLARGADPALATCRGETAHDLAVSRNHPEIAALLARGT